MAKKRKRAQEREEVQRVVQKTAQKKDFRRVDQHIWELAKDFRDDMRVPARLFGDAELFDAAMSLQIS